MMRNQVFSGTQAVNWPSADCAPAPDCRPIGELDEIGGHLSSIYHGASELRRRLEGVADRVWGSIPRESGKGIEPKEQAGTMHAVRAQLTRLDADLSLMAKVVEQIERLA